MVYPTFNGDGLSSIYRIINRYKYACAIGLNNNEVIFLCYLNYCSLSLRVNFAKRLGRGGTFLCSFSGICEKKLKMRQRTLTISVSFLSIHPPLNRYQLRSFTASQNTFSGTPLFARIFLAQIFHWPSQPSVRSG